MEIGYRLRTGPSNLIRLHRLGFSSNLFAPETSTTPGFFI
jgi:hypothetical protein